MAPTPSHNLPPGSQNSSGYLPPTGSHNIFRYLPPTGSQNSSGYFPSVSQICSEDWSRSSSCEANIDDEEDPRWSGIESSSPVLTYDNDDAFEEVQTSHGRRETFPSAYTEGVIGDQITARKYECNVAEIGEQIPVKRFAYCTPEIGEKCVTKKDKVAKDRDSCFLLRLDLSDSEGGAAEEMLPVVRGCLTEYESNEDQEVSRYCSEPRCVGGLSLGLRQQGGCATAVADYQDDDYDSLSTVASEPDSDVIIGSDVDPPYVSLLDRYVIGANSFQTTSQIFGVHETDGQSDSDKAPANNSLCISNRWSSGNKLGNLYIYEYVDDGDSTASDVINDADTIVDDVIDHSDNLAHVFYPSLPVTTDSTTLKEDTTPLNGDTLYLCSEDTGNSKHSPADSHRLEIKTRHIAGRTEKCEREAMLQTNAFLLRLSEYQIASSASSASHDDVNSKDCLSSPGGYSHSCDAVDSSLTVSTVVNNSLSVSTVVTISSESIIVPSMRTALMTKIPEGQSSKDVVSTESVLNDRRPLSC